ncbi:MAG: hypothetical protein GX971_03030 [Firmicutes bacterium]|nr:hypothetical protein [Bacillota bacterium]
MLLQNISLDPDLKIAIQVHPHDIRDEGAETVVRNIVERSSIRTIIAETGTLEERHPYPRGELTHNPVHKVLTTDASFEIPHSQEWFASLPFRPVLSPQANRGEDYISDLRAIAPRYGANVVPWVKALNASFTGEVKHACVYTFSGKPIPTWLCPNNPFTETYVLNLLFGILEKYPSRAILMDRLRYPDWSGATVSIERMLTCFCPYCQEQMKAAGIDVELLCSLLKAFFEDPQVLSGWMERRGLQFEVLHAWFIFRNDSITNLAKKIREEMQVWLKERDVETEYWLNLWPPSFAPLLGQDYKALGPLCQGAKHFPYHKLGGGADLAAFVRALSGESAGEEKRVFKELTSLLKLGTLTFEEYLTTGLPISFVAEQTQWGKDAFGDNRIFTGIQIWDIAEEEIEDTIWAAFDGKADGLFFYCYGWATLSALDRVGEILNSLRR